MSHETMVELVEDWRLGMLIAVACFGIGIMGASLLRGLPAGMEIGFGLGVLVTFLGISLLISRK